MAFTTEQLNFFKFSTVVLDEFPVILRQVFVFMWDNLVATTPGVPKWDDSVTVLNMLIANEGGVKKVPMLNKSYKDWDCTALFKATLFAQTFAMPGGTGGLSTMDKLYVKPRALSSGTFHPSVISPTGNTAETYALALDQLRLLRNTLFHPSSTKEIDKVTFDRYIVLTKDAFTALKQSTTKIDEIGNLGEEEFPTSRLKQLEDELKKEKDAVIKFKQINDHLNKIESQGEDVKTELTDVKTRVEDVGSDVKDMKTEVTDLETRVEDVQSDVKDVKTRVEDIQSNAQDLKAVVSDMKQAMEEESSKGPLLPDSCVPDKVPHFVGRQDECDAILEHLVNGSTQLVDVWGPPGFGKTSVAINVGHHLREMEIPVYFTSLRGMESKDDLVSKLLCIFSDAKQVPHISPGHWLLRCLRQLQDPFVLILDNADDLLESGDVTRKEQVLMFINEITAQCSHMKLLVTSRESLDCLSLKLPIHLERISVLDEIASDGLVRLLLPNVSDGDRNSIVKVCGQVPLAIRLMCITMTEENVSVSEFLKELEMSPLVDVLDNERYSDDARLKVIVNKSFERLTPYEKDVFVSLSVFPDCFEIKEALAVLDLQTVMKAKKIIRALESKALIDSSDSFSRFTIHSIFRSFVEEKRTHQKEIGTVFSAAQLRFYDYYISLFGVANEKFLTGDSNGAFADFHCWRDSIMLSLTNGTTEDKLYPKIVEVLSRSELFLYGLLPYEEFLFHNLYNSALQEAKKKQNVIDERKLLSAKSFAYWGWFSPDRQTWEHSLQELCTHTDCPTKLKCYHGIHQLLCDQLDEGISSLNDSVFVLGGSSDEEVLKLLLFIVLAGIHEKKQENELALYYQYLFNTSEKRGFTNFEEWNAFSNDDSEFTLPFLGGLFNTVFFLLVVYKLLLFIEPCLGPICASCDTSWASKEEMENFFVQYKYSEELREEVASIGFTEEYVREMSSIIDILNNDPELLHISCNDSSSD